MKIVIVEDERLTAEDLKEIILQVCPEAQVVKILPSVKEAVKYFKSEPLPDLIFSDIQLGDGLSFEIYEAVEMDVPTIFCTAYDEYALTAIQSNGIHYLLKPFDEKAVAESIEKFKKLTSNFTFDNASLSKVLDALQHKQGDSNSSVLVYQQDKVIPIKIKDIALFNIKNEVTHLLTFDQKTYFINKSLDEIQQTVGNDFYRANRQYIINREVVKEMSQTLSRKVSITLHIPFEEDILVSKEKMTDFLNWLKG